MRKSYVKYFNLLISSPNFCHDPPYHITLFSFKTLPKMLSQDAFSEPKFFPAASVRMPLFCNDPGLDLVCSL